MTDPVIGCETLGRPRRRRDVGQDASKAACISGERGDWQLASVAERDDRCTLDTYRSPAGRRRAHDLPMAGRPGSRARREPVPVSRDHLALLQLHRGPRQRREPQQCEAGSPRCRGRQPVPGSAARLRRRSASNIHPLGPRRLRRRNGSPANNSNGSSAQPAGTYTYSCGSGCPNARFRCA